MIIRVKCITILSTYRIYRISICYLREHRNREIITELAIKLGPKYKVRMRPKLPSYKIEIVNWSIFIVFKHFR